MDSDVAKTDMRNSGKVSVRYLPSTPIDDISGSVDEVWQERELVTQELVISLATLLTHKARRAFPDLIEVVLREDKTHLPAHGHIDALLSVNNVRVSPADSESGHHPWPEELDDLAWDIYHVAPHLFSHCEDGVRRLRLVIVDNN